MVAEIQQQKENWVIRCEIHRSQKEGQLYHDFYLSNCNEAYYLFSQEFRRGVHNYYRGGIRLSQAVDYSRSHRDSAIVRTMSKIPVYLRYVEQTEGLVVLERSKRLNARKMRRRTHGERFTPEDI